MDKTIWPIRGTDVVEKKVLKSFMRRDNWHGLVYIVAHLAVIFSTGTMVFLLKESLWVIPVFLIHGICIAFLFAPIHEMIHYTAFRSRSLNKIVGHGIALVILRPFLYLRYRHMAHHTFTQHPTMDPDRVPFPKNITDYLLQILAVNIWIRMLNNLLSHAMGRITNMEREFIPQKEIALVICEARLMMLVYAGVCFVSMATGSWAAIYLWLLPRIIGEPVLRAVRMVEHTGMEGSPNMLANTRTTATNFLIRLLYWQMPYHVEHHLYPSVPFHALRKLHEEYVASHIKEIAPGILRVHFRILKAILRGDSLSVTT